jgi:hypothetical protein
VEGVHCNPAPVNLCEWPGSTNLDKNMTKLSIGWSSSTNLHENLYRLFACRANALCRKQISTAEKDYRLGLDLNDFGVGSV